MLLYYWALSQNEVSIALAIGVLALAKLQQSIANLIFSPIDLLGPTKLSIEQNVLVMKNAIHYSLPAKQNHSLMPKYNYKCVICHGLGTGLGQHCSTPITTVLFRSFIRPSDFFWRKPCLGRAGQKQSKGYKASKKQ